MASEDTPKHGPAGQHVISRPWLGNGDPKSELSDTSSKKKLTGETDHLKSRHQPKQGWGKEKKFRLANKNGQEPWELSPALSAFRHPRPNSFLESQPKPKRPLTSMCTWGKPNRCLAQTIKNLLVGQWLFQEERWNEWLNTLISWKRSSLLSSAFDLG